MAVAHSLYFLDVESGGLTDPGVGITFSQGLPLKGSIAFHYGTTHWRHMFKL